MYQIIIKMTHTCTYTKLVQFPKALHIIYTQIRHERILISHYGNVGLKIYQTGLIGNYFPLFIPEV